MDEAIKQIKDEKAKANKRGRSKRLIFIFLIFLILAALSFALIYFNIFGAKTFVNNAINKIPFLKSSKTTSKDTDIVKTYLQKISELESQNKDLEEKLKSEQEANVKLQKQLSDVTNRLNDLITQNSNTQNKAKEFSNYIQSMDAKKASKIIENLIDTNVDMANQVLRNLSSEVSSEILSNISADKTIKLLGVSNKGSSSVQDLSNIVDIYKNMDAKVAASIFENMIGDAKKYNLALSILKKLDVKTSSQIISNMTASNAAKITQDLAALK